MDTQIRNFSSERTLDKASARPNSTIRNILNKGQQSPTMLRKPNIITEDTTLTQSSKKPIVIAANNITLDGAGFSLIGKQEEPGVTINGFKNVTIKNLKVSNFYEGIKLKNTVNLTLEGNEFSSNKRDGIDAARLEGSIIKNNLIENNRQNGLEFDASTNNLIFNNIARRNDDGFDLSGTQRSGEKPSPKNTLKNNIAEANKKHGFAILSDENTITGNEAKSNGAIRNGKRKGAGFSLRGSSNTFSNNCAHSNFEDGIDVEGSHNIIKANQADANGEDGFDIEGNRNQLTNNSSISNAEYGFTLSGYRNLLTNNRAMTNKLGNLKKSFLHFNNTKTNSFDDDL